MSRNATKTTCRKCGAHVRDGLDNDALALVARVDDEPLTRYGELLAVIDRRKTYSLEAGRLYRRHLHHLGKPAAHVYAQHRCWELMPAAWIQPPPAKPIDHDDPPF